MTSPLKENGSKVMQKGHRHSTSMPSVQAMVEYMSGKRDEGMLPNYEIPKHQAYNDAVKTMKMKPSKILS